MARQRGAIAPKDSTGQLVDGVEKMLLFTSSDPSLVGVDRGFSRRHHELGVSAANVREDVPPLRWTPDVDAVRAAEILEGRRSQVDQPRWDSLSHR